MSFLCRFLVVRVALRVMWAAAIAVLWVLAVGAFLWGLAYLAGIFTGDAAFGAYDGAQFIGAVYGAIYRFVVAFVLGYLVSKLMRWQPSRP